MDVEKIPAKGIVGHPDNPRKTLWFVEATHRLGRWSGEWSDEASATDAMQAAQRAHPRHQLYVAEETWEWARSSPFNGPTWHTIERFPPGPPNPTA